MKVTYLLKITLYLVWFEVSKTKFRPPLVASWWPIIFLWILRMVKVKNMFPLHHAKKRSNKRKYLIIWSISLREHLFPRKLLRGRILAVSLLCGVRTQGVLLHAHTEQGVILLMESIGQLIQTCFFHSSGKYSSQKPWTWKSGEEYSLCHPVQAASLCNKQFKNWL